MACKSCEKSKTLNSNSSRINKKPKVNIPKKPPASCSKTTIRNNPVTSPKSRKNNIKKIKVR